tara:strand:+ start:17963 stop:18307 length:345 start_codon:yes stop_codon:yes gene_type:complete
MNLHELNNSIKSGNRRGSSGFIQPKYYSKHKEWLGKVSEKTTGYTLTDYADDLEKVIVSNDYRLFYKHFYFADSNGELQDRILQIKDKEPPSDKNKEIIVNEVATSSDVKNIRS